MQSDLWSAAPDSISDLHSGPGWRPEFVLSLIQKTAEGPLYDRKLSLPIIRCPVSEVSSIDKPRVKSIRDFIVDVISLLNSARRQGKSAFMVFGVGNKWELNEKGVLDGTTWTRDPAEIESHILDNERLEYLQRVLIEKEDIRPHVERLVRAKPLDCLAYEFGWVEYKGRRYFLSYIEFKPMPTEKPFAVNPEIRKEDRVWLERLGLEGGRVFSRVGESNRPFVGEEVDLLLSWRDVPYISLAATRAYLEHHQTIIERSTPSIDNRLSNIGKQALYESSSPTNRTASEVISIFLSRDTDNCLIIQGNGGTGKSTLVRDTALELLQEAQQFMDSVGRNEIRMSGDEQPPFRIPIYVNFTGYSPRTAGIEEYIGRRLAVLNSHGIQHFERVLLDRELHFVVLCDSIDEVPEAGIGETRRELLQFIDQNQHIKFIVASRHLTFRPSEIRHHPVVNLAPLTVQQIDSRVTVEGLSADIRSQINLLVQQDSEVAALLSIPRMLTYALKSLESRHRLSMAALVEGSVDGYIEAECERLEYPTDGVKMRAELSSLATKFLNNEEIPFEQATNLAYYRHYLTGGLLVQSGHRIKFASIRIAEYLIAMKIINDHEYQATVSDLLTIAVSRQKNIVRFVASLDKVDVTDSSTDLGRWISTLDCNEKMLILLERRLFSVTNETIIRQIIKGYIDCYDPSSTQAQLKIGVVARKLITDESDIVFSTAAELAKEESALMAELRRPELLGYVAIHTPTRLPTLYSAILSSSPGQLQEVIEMLVLHVLETPTDGDLLFHVLDWSGGVPDVLIDQQLLGSGVDNQIRLAILNRMQQSRWPIPERWMDDMKLIAGSSDISLAELACELLGIPLHIDISLSTQYQESDADLQPSVLNQLESMEFREDT